MFKNILVAIDGSEQSNKAIDYALELVKTYQSRLELLHVYSYPRFILGEAFVTPPANIVKELQEYSKQVIDEANQKVESIPEANVTIEQGHPAKTIIGFAKENNCDLIIIGSRGLGAISEFVLGSVSHNVVQHSDIPVLVIK